MKCEQCKNTVDNLCEINDNEIYWFVCPICMYEEKQLKEVKE